MLKNQVAVLGLGLTGLSTVNFLLQEGYRVTVFDTRAKPPSRDKLNKQVELITGELQGESLAQFSLIICSPGIALATAAVSFAIDAGCEVIGDIELFARKLKTVPYQKAKCVIITGSNGKSTVTSLLGEMAENNLVKVAVGGNIGIPALDLLSPEIELYILELSSFQLETTLSLDADIAVILNISEDHLDRYDSYQHYIDTKHIIYSLAKKVLFNRDDPLTFPREKKRETLSFGFDNSCYGILTAADNKTYLSKNCDPLLAVELLKLSGKHNWMNALAALALGEAVNLDLQRMLDSLQQYTGLAHRCEFVANIAGVRWINDSKATNIGATQAALSGLSTTIAGKVHLILGGLGKGANFNELTACLSEIQGEIYCFGEDAPSIANVSKKIKQAENLQQAVSRIANKVHSGDLVILSPACASLDMYPNFMARGDHFKTLVKNLITELK